MPQRSNTEGKQILLELGTARVSAQPGKTTAIPVPTNSIRAAYSCILKSIQMALLKRINTASGVFHCQEKSCLAPAGSLQLPGRLAHDQLRDDFAVNGGDGFLFETLINRLENNRRSRSAHKFHGLADGSEGRRVEGCGRNVVETNHGTLLRYANTGFIEGANCAEGCHIVKGHQRGESSITMKEFLR